MRLRRENFFWRELLSEFFFEKIHSKAPSFQFFRRPWKTSYDIFKKCTVENYLIRKWKKWENVTKDFGFFDKSREKSNE